MSIYSPNDISVIKQNIGRWFLDGANIDYIAFEVAKNIKGVVPNAIIDRDQLNIMMINVLDEKNVFAFNELDFQSQFRRLNEITILRVSQAIISAIRNEKMSRKICDMKRAGRYNMLPNKDPIFVPKYKRFQQSLKGMSHYSSARRIANEYQDSTRTDFMVPTKFGDAVIS